VRAAKFVLWLERFTLVFAVVFSPSSPASVENPLASKEQIQVYKDFLNSYPSKAGFIDIPRKTAVFDDAPTDPCTQGLILEVRPQSSRETHLLPSNIIGENEHFRIVETELRSKSISHHHNLLRHAGRWLAIDPKPLIAEPEFDVVTLLWNPLHLVVTREVVERRMRQFTSAGLDEQRLRDWAVIRGTQLGLPLEPGEDVATSRQLAVVRWLLE
jgi:hypothetical protein